MSNKSSQFNLKTFKIIALGEYNVGKTTLLRRLTSNSIENMRNSIVDYFEDIIELNNSDIKLIFIDTGGQERFQQMTIGFCRRADCILYVYDITNRDSYNAIDEIDQMTGKIEKYHIKILIGCKLDLKNKRVIETKDAKYFAKERGFDIFYEIDNINNVGIDILKEEIINALLSKPKYKKNSKAQSNNTNLFIPNKEKKCVIC